MFRIASILLINALVVLALCLPGMELVPERFAPTLFAVFTALYLTSIVMFGMSARPVPRL